MNKKQFFLIALLFITQQSYGMGVIKKITGKKENKETPIKNSKQLIEAVENKDVSKVKKLLEAGKNPNSRDSKGRSVLCMAITWQYEEIAELLLANNAAITKEESATVMDTLIVAKAPDSSERILKLLLQKGMNPNTRLPYQQETALNRAVFCQNINFTQLLLNFGANPASVDQEGKSAEDYAKDISEKVIRKKIKALLINPYKSLKLQAGIPTYDKWNNALTKADLQTLIQSVKNGYIPQESDFNIIRQQHESSKNSPFILPYSAIGKLLYPYFRLVGPKSLISKNGIYSINLPREIVRLIASLATLAQ